MEPNSNVHCVLHHYTFLPHIVSTLRLSYHVQVRLAAVEPSFGPSGACSLLTAVANGEACGPGSGEDDTCWVLTIGSGSRDALAATCDPSVAGE